MVDTNTERVVDLTFEFPEPREDVKEKRLVLWATHYYVYSAKSSKSGQPLLDKSGNELGPRLSVLNWCKAAIEGTVRVTGASGKAAVYNHAGEGRTSQCDCSQHAGNLPPEVKAALGKKRWRIADGPFGDGVYGMILVPFRTIAVDPKHIGYRRVVYVPAARGKEIVLPSGRVAKHDGYFYTADTGSAIKGNHIDVFGGVLTKNPFPSFIRNKADSTFEAFVINDRKITAALDKLHHLEQFTAARKQRRLSIAYIAPTDVQPGNRELTMKGISTNIPCTIKATCIKKAGYDFIFRYYAKDKRYKKVVKIEEARAIAAAGLHLAIVFQNSANKISYFTHDQGKKDGHDAYAYALREMGQPANSAIYFGVDEDFSRQQIRTAVQNYFKGVLEGFNSFSNDQPIYRIGVYGSGLTCRLLRTNLPFVKYAWLAKPAKWRERETYKGWDVKQSDGEGVLCDIPGGRNGDWELIEVRTDDFGQFFPSIH